MTQQKEAEEVIMYNDKRKIQTVVIIMLTMLGIMNLCIGAPDAIKEYKRAKACTVEITAQADSSKSKYWSEHGGSPKSFHKYIEHTFVFSYGGTDYEIPKVFTDYGTGTAPKELTIYIDPDDPDSYVFNNERYADVGNMYIKLGSAMLASVVVLGGVFMISNMDYV